MIPVRSYLTHVALVAGLLMGCAPGAAAADWVLWAGRVDPPFGDQRAIGAPYPSLVRAWGPPIQPAEDVPIAVWPRGLEVSLTAAPSGSAVKFLVSTPGWRTPAGVRVRTSERRLRNVYGSRLVAVPDRRGLFGVTRHFMVRTGGTATGFVMTKDRVFWILTGTVATVRAELMFAGP